MKFNSLFTLLLVLLVITVQVHSQEPKLGELRNQFAQRYLQPDAHFALAKYYLDNRNYLQAFFILEYARRYRFEEKAFDEAYVAFFGDPMPEPPDEAKAAFEAGSKLVTQQKNDEAEIYFQKANRRYDRSFFINSWIGRFYYKTKSDSSSALPFYFNAYFLYPHAYETEYVESRIRRISIDDTENLFKASVTKGKPLPELVRDQNPLVVGMAIEEMAKSWKPEYARVMLEAMSNDDSGVRWVAYSTLQKYGGISRDQIADELLSSNDVRKRGLAAYSIVERPGPKKFEILKKILADPAELVRFDAVSALAQRGGTTGMEILGKHARAERQPRLKQLIDKALKGESKQD